MRRRSRTGREPAKGRRRKAVTPKRGAAPKAVRRRGASATGRETEVARLTRELHEALEQQAATAEVLRVISASPGELAPVFNAMIENATRLCGAEVGTLALYDGTGFGGVAVYGHSQRYADVVTRFHRAPPETGLGRLEATRQTVQVADVAGEAAYAEIRRLNPDFGRVRTALYVPIVKESALVGAFMIYRHELRPFTDKQIGLVQNFAAQAVIAIENTRLLNELRERTTDLTESLEQQTATSEVLRVISSTPGELEPVFQAMLANAVRICDAKFGTLFRFDGAAFGVSAQLGTPAELVEYQRQRGTFRPAPGTPLERLMRTKQVHHTADAAAESVPGDAAKYGGARSIIRVPMLKDDALVGAIVIYRQEVRPFTGKQIELLNNFAAQAVIAIENTRLLNELRQSLEQQTATADVLRVISSSPGDLEPVFQSMLANAVRICEATAGNIYRWDGEELRLVAAHNTPPAFVELLKRTPQRATTENVVGRMLAAKSVIHTTDVSAQPVYLQRSEPLSVAAVELGGVRTLMVVPMLKDDELIGAFTLYRSEVRPFADKQIELVKNFAAQAVIAIENTRLLNELRQSLEQQTATAEVLSVISSSPGDVEPVFQAMLENATRICEAKFGTLFRFDGKVFYPAAQVGTPPELFEFYRQRGPFLPEPHTQLDRVMRTKQVNHTADYAAEAVPGTAARLGGARSTVAVPMLKDDELMGAIVIYRQEVRPFSDKQIALVQNFANQAVIAIENTRLLSELRESLQQQTATAEVLGVISSSPGELEPVFQAMLRNAVRICDANFGTLYRFDGKMYHMAASVGTPPEFDEYQRRRGPFEPSPGIVLDQVMRTKQVNHRADIAAEPVTAATVRLGGARSIVGVPMLKDDVLIGAIVIYRQEVRPFTDKQIALVQNFAAQAVIAIENTRLLNELRESLEQQTATSEVLGVISSSPGELEPVFETLLANAVRICGAKFGLLFLPEGDAAYRIVALHGAPPAFAESRRRDPLIRLNPATTLGRVAETKRLVQVEDIRADPAYTSDPTRSPLLELAGARTMLNVPMLKEGELVGQIAIYRQEVRPFTDKQIALVQNFAAQAVIAIENTRLLSELRQRTTDLSRSLEDLRTAQDRLVQTEKLASLGQLTAGIAHEIKNPLNFVNNFSAVSVELIDELTELLDGVRVDDKSRAEMTELMDTLRGNLDKVVQHGKRADSIVKNMLLHSRQGSGERRPVDINALVEESLNLAYHGARAEKQGFNITLERSFDPAAGEADLFPQEITRVLLNLISNGFYAATRRKAEADGGDYEPTLIAATRSLGDSVEIRIRDNGTGIPPEVKEKLFNPFFTTKPAGEGTGLGLSISHDIIVKQHSGSIEVDTQPGGFTEFRIVLPRAAATVAKSGEKT